MNEYLIDVLSLKRFFIALACGWLLVVVIGCGEEPVTREVVKIPAAAKVREIAKRADSQQKSEVLTEAQRKADAIRAVLAKNQKSQSDAANAQAGAAASAQAGAPVPKRLLAALALSPDKKSYLTFNLLGPPDQASEVAEPFREFLQSLDWTAANELKAKMPLPAWKLPQGWTLEPMEDAFGRVATIRLIIDSGPLEIAVASFTANGVETDSILQNFNRWRGQLQLEPVSRIEELKKLVVTIALTKGEVLLLNEVGQFAGRMGPATSALATPPPSSNKELETARITYTTPSGWTSRPASAFRQASFATGQREEQADVGITVFPNVQAMGDVLSNVNRWRGELGLSLAKAEELPQQTKEFPFGDLKGTWFSATGTKEGKPTMTIAIMLPRDKEIWFLKMTGPAETVQQEEQHFSEFAQSLKFK